MGISTPPWTQRRWPVNDRRPLIGHVVYHFGTGGMENGMVMLFNNLPASKYRHAVICLAGYGDFRKRIHRQDITFHDLGKQAGNDLSWMPRLARLLKQLGVDILHTRNLNAMEAQFVAAWARVPGRVHGEHGRDIYDLDGTNWKYNLLRRAAKHFIHQYVAVSQDLAQWLTRTIAVPPARVNQIYNGVDGQRFHPRQGPRPDLGRPDFFAGAQVVIGSVGRIAAVKDYPTLLQAFARLLEIHNAPASLRLVLVGDGPQRQECMQLAENLSIGSQQVWFPGDRQDIDEWMRAMDVFVLPSIGEGISNTILEAMASGLPVVASRVGGNPELIQDGGNGTLFPVGDQEALAQALLLYSQDAQSRERAGKSARQRIEQNFIIERMARSYEAVYDKVLSRKSKE